MSAADPVSLTLSLLAGSVARVAGALALGFKRDLPLGVFGRDTRRRFGAFANSLRGAFGLAAGFRHAFSLAGLVVGRAVGIALLTRCMEPLAGRLQLCNRRIIGGGCRAEFLQRFLFCFGAAL